MYYPKNKEFSTKEYKFSPEYLRAKEKRKFAKKDVNRQEYFLDNLKRIFIRYEVLEWIDFDYCNCYEYKILLHRDQPILDDDVELIHALGGKKSRFTFIYKYAC